jgi:ribulose-5-phosphate 4-epimerase/fuculose-1-phosphate aldolase
MSERKTSCVELGKRDEVARTWRLCGRLGLVDTVFNHISVRLDSEEDTTRFLMNRSDRVATEACPEELVVVGRCGDDSERPAIQAGVLLHRAIYRNRTDVQAIIHLHSRAATAVSALECGLLGLTQTAMEFTDEIAYCDFAGVVESEEEGERVAVSLGNFPCALLRNHGLLTVGSSIQEAFYIAYYLEEACRYQVEVLGCQSSYIIPSSAVRALVRGQLKEQRAASAETMWHAMTRYLPTNPVD